MGLSEFLTPSFAPKRAMALWLGLAYEKYARLRARGSAGRQGLLFNQPRGGPAKGHDRRSHRTLPDLRRSALLPVI
jgi:hypothetical protein